MIMNSHMLYLISVPTIKEQLGFDSLTIEQTLVKPPTFVACSKSRPGHSLRATDFPKPGVIV